ncbi:MAG TPA: YciI family protein [Dehalococcoidia bacterium]
MRYLLLIYGDEANADASPETMAKWAAYTQEVQDKGLMEGGEALQPTSTATTVRVRGGETVATDGPFAETKEQLGGFYMLNCKDLDEAIEMASKIPAAPTGSIEVRPIMEFD